MRNIENSAEVLQYLIDSGKIDWDSTEEEMRQKRIEQIINQHPYSIYQGSDGKWYTHLPDDNRKEKRRRIARATLEDLRTAIYEHYTGKEEQRKLEAYTLETLYPKWIEYKSFHTDAQNSISRLNADWKKYYAGTPIVKIPIIKLKKLVIDEWIHKLIREVYPTRKQYTNFITIINQVLDYAVDMEIVESNEARKVKIDGKHLFRPEKKKESKTQVFSKEETKGVKELAWADFENRIKKYVMAPLAVLFQFETGVRIGELVVLRFEDVEGNFIRVERMYRRDSKEVVPYTKGTFGDRRVILTSEAKKIIETCRRYQLDNGYKDDGYIFNVDNQPCSYFSVSDLYDKYCRKLGIIKKTSHKTRKTVFSAMLDGNVNISSVREMAGHKDEKTTYASYVYDRSPDEEMLRRVEAALAG